MSTLNIAQEKVRLHITPLNREIYDRIIPSSLANQVANVSLHAVQTFPERGFGYVDMPRTEAEKLKKKLNGTTLKGTKIRIEEARPMKKRKSELEHDDAQDEGEKKRVRTGETKKKKLRQSKEQGVLAGHELESGRHVKRAWTEGKSKDKRDTAPSDKKLLFRTTVPPNISPLAGSAKSKPAKKESKEEQKKRKSGDKRTTVKEFAHHRKSFAIGQQDAQEMKPAVEYIDGQGWVDEDGVVVEAAPRTAQTKISTYRSMTPDIQETGQDSNRTKEMLPATQIRSSNGTTDGGDDGQGVGNTEEDSDDDEEEEESASLDNSDVVEPREVHPLEALYKKNTSSERSDNKLNLAPIDTSFSFFDTATHDTPEAEDEGIVRETNPQTPHTKQEFEWRAQRSAAPTPDTAAIDGRFGSPFGSDDDDDDEDDDDDDDDNDDDEGAEDTHEVSPTEVGVAGGATPTEPVKQEESAFRKFFYEHRGENDRAWKKKRREAKKQHRQRENRRLSRRVV